MNINDKIAKLLSSKSRENNKKEVTEKVLRLLKSENQDDVVLGLNLLPHEIKQKIKNFHVQSIHRIPLNLVGLDFTEFFRGIDIEFSIDGKFFYIWAGFLFCSNHITNNDQYIGNIL